MLWTRMHVDLKLNDSQVPRSVATEIVTLVSAPLLCLASHSLHCEVSLIFYSCSPRYPAQLILEYVGDGQYFSRLE